MITLDCSCEYPVMHLSLPEAWPIVNVLSWRGEVPSPNPTYLSKASIMISCLRSWSWREMSSPSALALALFSLLHVNWTSSIMPLTITGQRSAAVSLAMVPSSDVHTDRTLSKSPWDPMFGWRYAESAVEACIPFTRCFSIVPLFSLIRRLLQPYISQVARSSDHRVSVGGLQL